MPKKKTKLPINPTEKEYQHYNAVLLEEIRSQMSGVIETVQLTGQRLDEKIDGVEKRLTDSIEVVEMVVRKNSEDIQSLQANVKGIKQKLEDHDQQFTQLNEKMDRVVEKVEHHNEEISFLKTTVVGS